MYEFILTCKSYDIPIKCFALIYLFYARLKVKEKEMSYMQKGQAKIKHHSWSFSTYINLAYIYIYIQASSFCVGIWHLTFAQDTKSVIQNEFNEDH